MYHFKIINLEDGGYKFELGAIKMFVDDYAVNNDTHELKNPAKATAYFNIHGYIYGISNGAAKFTTAEAFYDSMEKQYVAFVNDENKSTQFLKRSA